MGAPESRARWLLAGWLACTLVGCGETSSSPAEEVSEPEPIPDVVAEPEVTPEPTPEPEPEAPPCDDPFGACPCPGDSGCDDRGLWVCDEATGPARQCLLDEEGGCLRLAPPVVCDDGLVCTGVEACVDDVGCVHGDPPADCCDQDADCDDLNPCNGNGTCDLSTETCQLTPPLACDDGNPCNGLEGCEADAGGCVPAAASPCDDNNLCDGLEDCDPTTGCLAGIPLGCDDGLPCNGTEQCDPSTGCVVGQPFAGCCESVDQCEDGNPCNGIASCDEDTGTCAVTAPEPCSDGDLCNGQEFCTPAGGCQPGDALLCNDGNPCNGIEACDPSLGCEASPPPKCDDENLCTGLESCEPALGCVEGEPLECLDSNACNGEEACDPAQGCISGAALVCNDEEPCNGLETCDPELGCVDGEPIECDDGEPCTDDGCSEGECTYAPSEAEGCGEEPGCPGAFACPCELPADCASGLCVEGAEGKVCSKTCAEDCPSGFTCSLDESDGQDLIFLCTPSDGDPDPDPNPEPDPDPDPLCEGNEDCDDGESCTFDQCHEVAGCILAPIPGACEDGDACTLGDSCEEGVCAPGEPAICEDSDPCTDDSCDPEGGCLYLDNAAPCDDGDPCTKGDTCTDGSCVVSEPVDCDDGVACTADGCSPLGGCKAQPNDSECEAPEALCQVALCDPALDCIAVDAEEGELCEDSDACTEGTSCAGGACAGTQVACDDGDPCTEDACLSEQGCVVSPGNEGGGCDDGDACTGQGSCVDGVCAPGSPLDCDDEDPCTLDVCEGGECLSASDIGPCEDTQGCADGLQCVDGECTPPYWDKSYATPDRFDEATDVVLASGGGVAISGHSRIGKIPSDPADGRILRLGSFGEVIWDTLLEEDGDQRLNAIAEAPDGSFVAVGTTDTESGFDDLWIVRVDDDGDLLVGFPTTLGGTGHDTAYDVLALDSGSFLLATRWNTNNQGPWDIALVAEVPPDGSSITWQALLGDAYEGRAVSLEHAPGGYVVGAQIGNQTSSNAAVGLAHLDTLGGTSWTQSFEAGYFNNSGDLSPQVVSNPSGGYALASWVSAAADTIVHVRRLDALGDEIWAWQVDGWNLERPNDLGLAPNGDLVLAGRVLPCQGCDQQGLIARISDEGSSGATVFVELLGGSDDDILYGVAVTPSDELVLVGSHYSFFGETGSLWVQWTDGSGALSCP